MVIPRLTLPVPLSLLSGRTNLLITLVNFHLLALTERLKSVCGAHYRIEWLVVAVTRMKSLGHVVLVEFERGGDRHVQRALAGLRHGSSLLLLLFLLLLSGLDRLKMGRIVDQLAFFVGFRISVGLGLGLGLDLALGVDHCNLKLKDFLLFFKCSLIQTYFVFVHDVLEVF